MLLGLKNLLRRKGRTALTTIGIAFGIAAVVIFSAFGTGMAQGFAQASSSSEADLMVSQKDAMMIILGALDEEIGDEIARLRGVAEVTGTIVGIVQMPESPYFLVTGEDPHSFVISHYRIITGRAITSRRQVMLGRQTAENQKKNIGERFTINGTSYQIVGIYETGTSFEDNGAVISLEDAQRSFDKRRQVNYFNIKLHDVRQAEAIRTQIEERWDDVSVLRSGEPSKQDEILAMYNSMGWFLGMFAIIVGGLGMMTALLMSVFERTREIGVLRAVGWRRRRVMGMILSESMLLALIGGLLGIALGMGTLLLAGQSSALSGFLSGTVDPALIVQAMITALVLGFVGGLYPAWRASRLAPVEAMRSESGAPVHWGWFMRGLSRLVRSEVLRNLMRRPTRTLMTAISLGIGVGFILLLLGIADGSRDMFTQLTSAGQADLIAEQEGASDATFSSINERVADRISFHPAVRSVSQLLFGTASVEGVPFFLIYGIDPQEDYYLHYRIQEGRMPERAREIAIGRLAANGMEKGVGDKLRLGSSYEIVGIFENGQPYEDAGAVMLLKEAQRMLGKPRQVSFLSISLHDPSQAAAVAVELERANPEVIVSQAAEMTERMQDFVTMNAVFSALVTLMFIVGGVVMANVMVMSVFERTQEIGVLRAVGWSRQRVLRIVLGESLALGVLSAVIGGALGPALGVLIQMEPTMGAMLVTSYTTGSIITVIVLSIAIGAVGGLLPAWRASNLRPVEALRYE